jgi:WhiB family redox-sensing transcriptional regulator
LFLGILFGSILVQSNLVLANFLLWICPFKGFFMSLIWNRTHAWDDADWRADAACRDTEPELFFPIGTTGMATDQIESAKRVCDHCDAQKACLEFALATNQESGVWGGTTEDERRKLRKQWLAARRRSNI